MDDDHASPKVGALEQRAVAFAKAGDLPRRLDAAEDACRLALKTFSEQDAVAELLTRAAVFESTRDRLGIDCRPAVFLNPVRVSYLVSNYFKSLARAGRLAEWCLAGAVR
jgi:hypothetical protein